MAEPGRHPVIQAFLDWVRRARVYAILEPSGQERRAFVPIQKLETYFTEQARQNLNDILDAAFLPEDPPLYAENIVPKYTAVFAILLHINKQRYIKHFTQYGALSDSHIPFDLDDPPPKFPMLREDPNFFSQFCDEQWKFCTPKFQRHMLDEQFENKRILPITYKERLGGGGSGTLYKIKIHKLYNELILDEEKTKLSEESASTFVLKTYITEEARKYYENEVAAFRRLRPTPNIIEFYGSYIHGDSFNVLLEYADKGTLERYFQEEPEPRTGEDVIKFWRSIFMLGQALTGIHQVDSRASGNGPPIFQGWHQDIKPENILVVSNDARSPYDWQFKLGDLGLSHFNSKVVSSGEPTASDAHGTRTYGAPECYRADDWVEQSNITVKQNVDIWSLGCVYSEAARWVAGGRNGLKAYREERKAETDLIRHFRDGDCFHNGENALRAVQRSHKTISNSLGRHDHITERAIDVMVKEMLSVSAGRPTATMIWIKSQRILGEAQEELDQGSEMLVKSRKQTHSQHQHNPPLPPQLPPGMSRTSRLQHAGASVQHISEAGNEYNSQVLDGEQSHSPESASETGNDPFFSPTKRTIRGDAALRPMKVQHSSDNKVSYGGTGDSLSDEVQLNQDQPNGQSHAGATPSQTPGNSKSVSFDTYAERNSAPNLPTRVVGASIIRSTTGNLSRHSRDLDHGKGKETAFEIVGSTSQPQSYGSFYSSSPPNMAGEEQNGGQESQVAQSVATSSQPTSPRSPSVSRQEIGHEREASYGSSSGTPHREYGTQKSSPEPEQAGGASSEELPLLSIENAIIWKQRKKAGHIAHLNGEGLIGRLGKRDHMFLVDDSISMKPHWERVKLVLEALSYIVKDCDPDGTELYFTASKDYKRDKNTSGLLYMLNGRALNGLTDIDHRLIEILEKYKSKLDAKPSLISSIRSKVKNEPIGVRPLNIYILTDGMWESKSTGETTIINFVQKLIKLGKPKSQVGIQFISFGNNPIGIRKMEFLDSELGRGRKEDEWLDIVDTTPSTGNVWKMLLGGINPTWDDD